MEYYVVFEYTKEAHRMAGTRYRTGYSSEDEFNRMHDFNDKQLKVVAKGVSDVVSLRLCEEVPIGTLTRSAAERSRDNGGAINQSKLRTHLANVLFAQSSRRER